MVYILAANVSFKYDSGARSHIVYIGTTGKGGRRPATSAIDKASDAFYELRGVKEIRVYIATCKARKAVRTWSIWNPPYWRCSDKCIGSFQNTTSARLFRKHG